MRLLVVGGTAFVGRHAVEAAVADGHDVTVFHRGRTNSSLLAGEVTHRLGDRDGGDAGSDYTSLASDDAWDAVIDVSAYVPRHVHELFAEVGDRCRHYVHVSSISAYAIAGMTLREDSPLAADLDDPDVEDVDAETYGPLKAMGERAARQSFGATRTAVVRPTYVAGPHDHTERFTYWARRMVRGGDVAVIDPESPLQIIDARDLGAFLVRLAVDGTAGAFDAVGPYGPISDLLARIAPEGVDYRLVSVSSDVLAEHGVRLPLLAPSDGPVALQTRPGTGARAAGLATRPVEATAMAIRELDVARCEPDLPVGPSPAEEAALFS
ncbi:SDR family oxidoreductase [soil metagenome]